ncbi:MAG: SusD/RagB family nutrient-binding outer membrane lipoprotein [Puia sp.]|nr:SusD/RagB family nutrient-binding outer membrane lipoprotein [Puia sp.]
MIRKIIIISGLALTLFSCTKNFSSINVDPTKPTSVPLDYTFAESQLMMAGSQNDPGYTQWRTDLMYSGTLIQEMASINGGQYPGDKYLYSDEPSGAWFGFSSSGEGHYLNAIKNMVQLIASARQDSVTNVNILSMTRILKVFLFQEMTDIYGDVPYFQAGLGYISQTYTPPFDRQKDIYADMLNELAVAGAALNASAYIPSGADFAYNGNLTAWQHFANSLMLRLAMRLQKVDPTTAQTWAAKAIAGGLIASNAESFLINWPGGPSQSINPNSYNLGASNNSHRGEVALGDIQWGRTLINLMKKQNDPRLGMIATIPTSSGPQPFAGVYLGDTVAAHQYGLPNGFLSGQTLMDTTGFSSAAGCCFSVPNPYIYQDNSPQLLLTYAESEFLKTEAIERGWASGNAQTEFQTAQAASLQTILAYNNSTNGSPFVITPGAISAYQATNPYPATSIDDKMSAIGNEMYTLQAVCLNFIEEWAYWRRTGYPGLNPVNYPGNATGGTIPRRLAYPTEEATLNAANYQAAIANQGKDLFTTRVYWDVAQ